MAKNTCTEYLRYDFPQAEVRELGQELARKINEKGQAELELASVKATFKDKSTKLDAEISVLARQTSNGYEFRNIDCKILWHTPTTGACTVVREDTGEEVRVRSMTKEECQDMLPFPAAEALASDEQSSGGGASSEPSAQDGDASSQSDLPDVPTPPADDSQLGDAPSA